MPRGTTLVGLPQPTQSVQNKILLDTVPYDNGRHPAKLNGFRAFRGRLFAHSSWAGSVQAWMLAFTLSSSL
jgi:hypothetical protein